MNADAKASLDTVVTDQGEKIPMPEPVAAEKPKMGLAAAKSKTERLLQFRNMLQSRALALGAGDISRYREFDMEKWEMEMLADVYADQVMKLGHIPPWVDILIVEVMIIGPRIYKVFDIRKEREENARLQAENEQLKMQLVQNRVVQTSQPAPATANRPDVKKYWQINSQGNFLYATNGVYIKENEPQQRAELTPENYRMLVKYNGADKVNAAFNIPAETAADMQNAEQ